MSFKEQDLYDLLPAIYRIRDAEEGQPLLALLSVFAEQVEHIEENLAQLYDDQFIETCADWVVPYIGDLIGYRPLDGNTSDIASPRAEVAHTIAFRRRKGTATMLEQLARDVTGWHARAVEFFQILATTQYMNHVRHDHPYALDLRDWRVSQWLGTAFERTPRTVEVRRIAPRRGRYNIKNVGLFLWRKNAYSWKKAVPFKVDSRRFFINPLGTNTQLFTSPVSEEEIHHLATPVNVPQPISRRLLHEQLNDYYGQEKSISITAGGVLRDKVVVCNLSDAGAGSWAHHPKDSVGIDPELGRITFPSDESSPASVEVSFHYGFSADMGGGEYDRSATMQISPATEQVDTSGSIQSKLNTVAAGGVVELVESKTYSESISITVGATQEVVLRALNGRHPLVDLGATLDIHGGMDGVVTLDGLVLNGAPIRLQDTGPNQLRRLRLRHSTLVPGISLQPDRSPDQPGSPSLIVEIDNLTIEIEDSIVGSLRVSPGSNVVIKNSIIDANARTNVAFADIDGSSAGAELTLEACTVIGKVHTRLMKLASNTILLAETTAGDGWAAPVHSQRRQVGCVRYSYVPLTSLVPRRHHCHPVSVEEADRVRPIFTSLQFGHEGYAQLARHSADEIRLGADDESEIGAFHKLYQPQREGNLRVRLQEYLRFGLEAGIFYAT